MATKSKKHSAGAKLHSWARQVLWGVVYGVAGLFLLINALSSQYMPDLFFRLISRTPGSFVDTAIRAKELPGFQSVRPEVLDLMSQYEGQIYSRESIRQSQITLLEGMLSESPDARDVVYALSLLYREEGDIARADSYLQKAKSIDPLVQK